MEKERNILKEAIVNPDTFCITWEQIAGRGAFEKQQEEIFKNARTAARGGRIHGISITDNPSGNPAFATEMLCVEVKKLGIEPLVHFALRDKNRNEIESLLYGMAAARVRNLLVLSGDYPSENGFSGIAKPVFDLDRNRYVSSFGSREAIARAGSIEQRMVSETNGNGMHDPSRDMGGCHIRRIHRCRERHRRRLMDAATHVAGNHRSESDQFCRLRPGGVLSRADIGLGDATRRPGSSHGGEVHIQLSGHPLCGR
jgi:hypothetical protein